MNNPYDKDFFADGYHDWLYQDNRGWKTHLITFLNVVFVLAPLVYSEITYLPSVITLCVTGISYYLVKWLVYETRIAKWREWKDKNED